MQAFRTFRSSGSLGCSARSLPSGLYRWELKNIGICHWLAHLGREVEKHRFDLTEGQFLERPHPKKFAGRWRIEKPQAERLIYGTAISAWLLLPGVAALVAAAD